MSEIKYVLGVDCSSKRIDAVMLNTKKEWICSISLESKSKDMDIRLTELYSEFYDEVLELVLNIENGEKTILDQFEPIGLGIYVVVENPVYVQNIKATVGITQVVAAAKLVAYQLCESFIGVDNRHWKKHVLGNGVAGKDKIMEFAKSVQGDNIESQDLADAYCLALWGVMRIGEG